MFKQMYLKELKTGMVLTQPLLSRDGSLMVEAGTLLTDFIIGSLQDPDYMERVLPDGMTFEEMKLNVFGCRLIPVRRACWIPNMWRFMTM